MDKDFKTRSGIPVSEYYDSLNDKNFENQPNKKLGSPGQYPFTRGVQKSMYRGRLWTMRQYAGFGSAAESNLRYHYLLSQGTNGLSIAFDLPTQLGLDPDHPRSQGEVGKVGVSISTLDDMRSLFKGISVSQISTSMTINATAGILFAFYVALAEEQGACLSELRGTIQNDILKEYIARGNYIYPIPEALRLTTDIFSWCSKHTPKWNPISISGYHIREAGSTAVQELAFTFANAIAYVEAAQKQGLEIDQFAGQLSFFFNVHSDFFEEIAKFRAARRIWANLMKNRFQAKDPKSWMLRFHSQTAGSTLTAQQPQNNTIRVTLQALSSVLGGTQSLHTNSFDEALALPTEASALLALRTQQIIAHESGVAQTVDPLAGSYFIELLTDEIEKRTWEYLEVISQKGGTIKCIENNFIQNEILNSAYSDQKKIDSGELKIIGVNCFENSQNLQSPKIDVMKISPDLEKEAIQKIQNYKKNRSSSEVSHSLKNLQIGLSTGANLQELILVAVKAGATLGEISEELKKEWGAYQYKSGF